MEQKRPKRRKDKYNPYTIYQSDEKYYIEFYDIGEKEICMEITEELFQAFNSFELEDKRQLNIFDRYMEHSEIYEWSLEERSQQVKESVENEVIKNIIVQKLHTAINLLPDTQRQRLIYYYFENMTYEQIAEIEGCSYQAVMKSIRAAERKLKKRLE